MNILLPSKHQIDDCVWVTIRDKRKVAFPDLPGIVTGVLFQEDGEFYNVGIVTPIGTTTISHIEGQYVKERKIPTDDEESVQFEVEEV